MPRQSRPRTRGVSCLAGLWAAVFILGSGHRDAEASPRIYDFSQMLGEAHPFSSGAWEAPASPGAAGKTSTDRPARISGEPLSFRGTMPTAQQPGTQRAAGRRAGGASGRLYDMTRFLNEPHPFAGHAGSFVAATKRTRLKARELTPDGKTAKFNFADLKKEGVVYVIDVDDPLEGMNRGFFWFNAQFDKWVFLPVVDAYRFVTPEFARDRVTNFFDNLREITTFANQILQAKFTEAGKTVARFGVNSVAGLAGLFNTAEELGLPRINEDFGQTRGFWGIGNGPYLVLPILGPSNLRDGVGLLVDYVAFAAVDPYNLHSIQTDNPYILALKIIDGRHKVPFRYYESGSPFEYDKVRLLYTTKRRLDIAK